MPEQAFWLKLEMLLEVCRLYVEFQLTWTQLVQSEAKTNKATMTVTQGQCHKLNHKFLSDVKAAEKGVCLSEGNEAAESDGTTLDFM